MKDIQVNTPFIRVQYIISWIAFILLGFIVAWLVAIGLYTYGRDTPENKDKKKGVLNMTYQKFIFVWGTILGDLFIIVTVIWLIV